MFGHFTTLYMKGLKSFSQCYSDFFQETKRYGNSHPEFGFIFRDTVTGSIIRKELGKLGNQANLRNSNILFMTQRKIKFLVKRDKNDFCLWQMAVLC